MEDSENPVQEETSLTSINTIHSGPRTTQDIATLAKVSRATVSYVLNDVKGARVSQETRERVLQAASQLGYIPHKIASSLRSGKSDLVILPFFDWPYNQSSISFLQELALHLDQYGYSVMFRFFRQKDKGVVAQKIASSHPIGVIAVSDELSRADVDLLTRNGVKAVLAYGGSPSDFITPISVDFTTVGESVGQYLFSRGHRHIGVIIPKDPRIINLGLERLEGLKHIGQKNNLQIERIDMGFTVEEAALLARKWVAEPHPTAVFAYNDEYAHLLMSSLQDVNFRIPEDIAIVGCDDLPLCEFLRPRLTSVNHNPGNPVNEIATFIHQMIQGQVPENPPHIPLSSKIIVRESS